MHDIANKYYTHNFFCSNENLLHVVNALVGKKSSMFEKAVLLIMVLDEF